MARKRYKYVFTRKKHTKGGKLSSILAFASFLLFVGSAICSMMMGGKGGLYLGAAGFIAIGFSVYGFILGLKSFSEENRNVLYSNIKQKRNHSRSLYFIFYFPVQFIRSCTEIKRAFS